MSDTPYVRESRLKGRLSGRTAPREHQRIPAREATYVEHGLMSAGDADPRQGQLFDPGNYEIPQHTLAQSRGLPAPREASGAGFMPGMGTRKQKASAIRNWSSVREEHGSPSTMGGTLRQINASRDRSKDSNWYGSRDPSVEGESVGLIREAAQATDTSVTDMSRATAVTSPQMPWTAGNPMHRTYPNIDVAKNVARHVRGELTRTERRSFSAEEIGAMGEATPHQGLFKDRAALAFTRGGESAQPIVPSRPGYAKVPNFNENLLGSRQDVPQSLRRSYSSGVTLDSHMFANMGLSEDVTKRGGVYGVEQMLHTRSAFKNREMPMNQQASIWSKQRPPDPLSYSADIGRGYYEPVHSLFQEPTGPGGPLKPTFDFSPGARPTPTHDRRSDTAKKHGLEF